jgi:hypothetical protein
MANARSLEDLGLIEMNEAMDTLINENRSRIVSVEEHVFVSKYLPLLTATQKVDLTPWVELAGGGFQGGQFKPVHVVKNGQLLFTVPPLFATPTTYTKYDERQSISTVVDQLQSKARAFNLSMDIALPKTLQGLYTTRREQTPDHSKAWAAILQRYGIVTGTTESSVSTQALSQTWLTDDDTDDDWA